LEGCGEGAGQFGSAGPWLGVGVVGCGVEADGVGADGDRGPTLGSGVVSSGAICTNIGHWSTRARPVSGQAFVGVIAAQRISGVTVQPLCWFSSPAQSSSAGVEFGDTWPQQSDEHFGGVGHGNVSAK
jgi:hypothetical protein